MFPALFWMLAQTETRANQPTYFIPVFLILLIAGGLGWMIAMVLGFQRARAFGTSTKWFAYSAVCMLVYHLQFVVLALFIIQDDADMVLKVGAFFNLFAVLAAVCAIMGFVKLTNPS